MARDFPVVIYHNPACGTSRAALGLLREAGFEPSVVEYLETPPSPACLADLAARVEGGARALLRNKEPLVHAMGLDDPFCAEGTILGAIATHPMLLNRPVVATALGVAVCRPADRVAMLLPAAV